MNAIFFYVNAILYWTLKSDIVCVCKWKSRGRFFSFFPYVEYFDGYGSSQMEESLKEAKKI